MASTGVQTRSAATVYPLRAAARATGLPELHIALRIDNYEHVAIAYGEATASAVQTEVHRVLSALLMTGGVAIAAEPGVLGVFVWDVAGFLPWAASGASYNILLETLVSAVGPISIPNEILPICVVLSGACVPCDKGSGTLDFDADAMRAALALVEERRLNPPTSSAEEWQLQYRHDMTVAADLFEAKAQNRLQLAWQPVRHAVETGDILYYECLLRIIDANGDLQTPDRFLPSLERLGLMRALDRHVVLSVIDELRADSTIRLGANVSAQSAVDDVWWNGIFETLRTNRKLASRLVVEITETAAFPSIPQAVHFIASLRALGCVVALDDFGMGHSSIRQLITLQPNMVKIDAFFVRHARRSRDGRKCLEHLIGLASTIAGDVVIEGIESDEQSTLAKVSGGLWQQGYHHGCPAVTRPSKFGRIVEPSGGIGCHAPETLFSRPGDTVVLPARFHPLGLLWAIPIGLVLWAAIIGAGLGIWRVLP